MFTSCLLKENFATAETEQISHSSTFLDGRHSWNDIQLLMLTRQKRLSNTLIRRYAVALSVEALCYKPEGRGFDSRWCHNSWGKDGRCVGLTLPPSCADCPEILEALTSWGTKDLYLIQKYHNTLDLLIFSTSHSLRRISRVCTGLHTQTSTQAAPDSSPECIITDNRHTKDPCLFISSVAYLGPMPSGFRSRQVLL
jgi:hypothetical protein